MNVCRVVLTGWLGLSLAATAWAEEELAAIVQQAIAAYRAGDSEQAIELANRAVTAYPQQARAWSLRGQLLADQEQFAQAVADFDWALELDPTQVDLYQHRGSERFKLGQIEESIADFDRYLEARPQRVAHHWQRGISYYYAGRFADGAKQFEQYQNVDGNDVENAVWRYICTARESGVEQAQRELLPIGFDPRVPLMEVYELFAGRGSEAKVLAAVEAGDPTPEELKLRRFYAHLYLGLYHEVHNNPELARQHIDKAASDYCPARHYMGYVAKVHAARLAAKK